MFVYGSFIVDLIFYYQIMGINFHYRIFNRAIYLVNAKLRLTTSEFHLH